MKTITFADGQTFVEIERDGKWSILPVNQWLEERLAVLEVALAFELLAEKKHEPTFRLFLNWLLRGLQEKYGENWEKVFKAYLDSPYVRRLAARRKAKETKSKWYYPILQS
jgi:hypothetical protein